MTRPPELLAEVVRDGFVESRHHGQVSVADAHGAELARSGDTTAQMFARSSLKPLQLLAMLRLGLGSYGWSPDLLALMASSHSGQPCHVAGVGVILGRIGLDESALQNTPALPMDPRAREELRRVGTAHKASVYADCSGKHAAMLATCLANDWSTADYCDPQHPLQRSIRDVISEMTSDPVMHTAVDGCGAALFSCTTAGLARAYARLAAGEEGSLEHTVAQAMQGHPVMVAGDGRDFTAAMRAVPSLVAKDGAEGVLAAGVMTSLHGPVGIAIKISDGAARPRPVVLHAALAALGVTQGSADWAVSPVFGGGRVVGHIQSALTLLWDA